MNGRNEELEWFAFQYVTGELTAEEEQHFEQQLAEDQSARDAVQRAVLLNDAVRLAIVDQPNRLHPALSASIRALQAVVIVIAGGLLVACLIWFSRTESDSSSMDGAVTAGSGELPDRAVPAQNRADTATSTALAWVRVRATTVIDSPDVEMLPWNQSESDVPDSDVAVRELVEADLPSWLLSAVASEGTINKGER